jgi:L-threonylcarbamoyladenylate synthase
VKNIHPRVETLLLFHTRPLTVIYEQCKNLPLNACAANGSVAIRIPHDDFCKSLLEAFGKPIVATTAQVSGTPMPKHFGEISSDIIMGVDHVVKHRTLDKDMGELSVLARLNNEEELEFLRE